MLKLASETTDSAILNICIFEANEFVSSEHSFQYLMTQIVYLNEEHTFPQNIISEKKIRNKLLPLYFSCFTNCIFVSPRALIFSQFNVLFRNPEKEMKN